ncbi:hypothetical protein FA15DRAFT_755007 [Coprinopsis marcescibilis]|uniref:Uncharacterized protein n=1 Tax=Coprinopsis marcescibilis TaxID=230819 RepID=A0A5C3L0S0_COPMA|nr:hypothetical protein FA15DRAFT_755007 [Coprinopsis marcescibilis]
MECNAIPSAWLYILYPTYSYTLHSFGLLPMRSFFILIPALSFMNMGLAAPNQGSYNRGSAAPEKRQFHTTDFNTGGSSAGGEGPFDSFRPNANPGPKDGGKGKDYTIPYNVKRAIFDNFPLFAGGPAPPSPPNQGPSPISTVDANTNSADAGPDGADVILGQGRRPSSLNQNAVIPAMNQQAQGASASASDASGAPVSDVDYNLNKNPGPGSSFTSSIGQVLDTDSSGLPIDPSGSDMISGVTGSLLVSGPVGLVLRPDSGLNTNIPNGILGNAGIDVSDIDGVDSDDNVDATESCDDASSESNLGSLRDAIADSSSIGNGYEFLSASSSGGGVSGLPGAGSVTVTNGQPSQAEDAVQSIPDSVFS